MRTIKAIYYRVYYRGNVVLTTARQDPGTGEAGWISVFRDSGYRVTRVNVYTRTR